MVPVGHSDWLTGVSRLVRPVPVRILRCPVDRSFLIRLRRSLWSAMHRTRTPTVFPTLPSTAGTTAIGMVRQSRLRPLPTSSIATFPRRKYRLTTITASPSRSTPRLASIWALADERSARAADHYEWQQPIAEQQQSVSVAEHWAKQHPNPGHQFRAVE